MRGLNSNSVSTQLLRPCCIPLSSGVELVSTSISPLSPVAGRILSLYIFLASSLSALLSLSERELSPFLVISFNSSGLLLSSICIRDFGSSSEVSSSSTSSTSSVAVGASVASSSSVKASFSLGLSERSSNIPFLAFLTLFFAFLVSGFAVFLDLFCSINLSTIFCKVSLTSLGILADAASAKVVNTSSIDSELSIASCIIFLADTTSGEGTIADNMSENKVLASFKSS